MIFQIFGTINPPQGAPTNLGNFIGGAVRIFLLVVAFAVLIYLLWGALDWITSGGDKEKLTKAQNKITNAVIGLVVVFAMLSVFLLLTGNILHIITVTPTGWTFNLPRF